mmetsp:Transcript_157/g.473  ORF Transcript_157/g.473 Transcript_157/m.473 type:complete len:94 (+) Transcript_157:582-863(+)
MPTRCLIPLVNISHAVRSIRRIDVSQFLRCRVVLRAQYGIHEHFHGPHQWRSRDKIFMLGADHGRARIRPGGHEKFRYLDRVAMPIVVQPDES